MKKTSPILFSNTYRVNTVIDDFLKAFYFQQLNYMASDLLDKGYTPNDILEALNKAMKICRNANRRVEDHFMPLYSDRNGQTVRDCKLSLFGYRLLLLNANPDHPTTARFQISIIENISAQAKPRKNNNDRHL